MKSLVLSILLLCLAITGRTGAQSGDSSQQGQEPKCTCDQPEFIFDLGGKLKLDYKELNVCTLDDGSLLLQDRNTDKYYILSGGVTSGPYESEDPKLMGFENCYMESSNQDDQVKRYKGILSKSGDKYLITFKGKNYGPFIDIMDFCVTLSREKFAVLATAGDGEMPKLITNIPDATFDVINTPGSFIKGSMKYDDIVVLFENKILNLQGKTLFTVGQETANSERIFINQASTKYASYDFGALNFSDGKYLPDLFNPHFVKSAGTIYLAYMYYSPKRNAIMQCKVPF